MSTPARRSPASSVAIIDGQTATDRTLRLQEIIDITAGHMRLANKGDLLALRAVSRKWKIFCGAF